MEMGACFIVLSSALSCFDLTFDFFAHPFPIICFGRRGLGGMYS